MDAGSKRVLDIAFGACCLLVMCALPLQPMVAWADGTNNASGKLVAANPSTRSLPPALKPQPSAHDGQHDFDFLIGTWKTHLSRRLHPLTGSNAWVEYEGTSVVRGLWGGKANLEEFEADGSNTHVQGLTLSMYDPQSHQWNSNWAVSSDGSLGRPMIGGFEDGHGEFFDQEPFGERAIYVRWTWTEITANTCRFEQSFSADGGKTWEVNWINTYTRVPG